MDTREPMGRTGHALWVSRGGGARGLHGSQDAVCGHCASRTLCVCVCVCVCAVKCVLVMQYSQLQVVLKTRKTLCKLQVGVRNLENV